LTGNIFAILKNTSYFQNYATSSLINNNSKQNFSNFLLELMISVDSNTNFVIDTVFINENLVQNDSINNKTSYVVSYLFNLDLLGISSNYWGKMKNLNVIQNIASTI